MDENSRETFLFSNLSFLTENVGFYVKDQTLIKIDFKEKTQKEVLIRKSGGEARQDIVYLAKFKADSLLVVFADLCVRMIEISDTEKNSQVIWNLGFICKFCLKSFSNYTSLYRNHIHLHNGPVKCESCFVSELS